MSSKCPTEANTTNQTIKYEEMEEPIYDTCSTIVIVGPAQNRLFLQWRIELRSLSCPNAKNDDSILSRNSIAMNYLITSRLKWTHAIEIIVKLSDFCDLTMKSFHYLSRRMFKIENHVHCSNWVSYLR